MVRINAAIVVLVVGCVAGGALADVHTLITSTSVYADFDDAASWSPAQVPVSGDIITVGGGRKLYVDSAFEGSLSAMRIGYTSSTQHSAGHLRVDEGANIATQSFYMADYASAYATATQYGGTLTVATLFQPKAQAGSGYATYNMINGTLNSNTRTDLGYAGRVEFYQSGGTFNARNVSLGMMNYASLGENSAVAYYNMTGGTLNVTNWLYIGSLNAGGGVANGGRGYIKLGNEAGQTGTIAGAGASLVINKRDGVGIVQGFGDITMTGTLENNGKVIADGWGGANTSDRTLRMANFTSLAFRVDGYATMADAGWYATNRGKLVLPTINVAGGTSTAYYGEASDAQVMINSIKMDFAGVAGGQLNIALLANDNSEAQVPGTMIGVWDIDGAAFSFGGGSVDMRIKYDEALAASLGLVEADLKLYHRVGSQWVDVTGSVDTTNNYITASGVDSFSQFAVGAIPEPATVGMLMIGACAGFLKRRRS